MPTALRSAPPARRVVRARELAVIIPAHNEADAIAGTLDALSRQTAVPRRVIVVADNCTDETGWRAAAHGAHVIETKGNTHRKAGALNQALAALGDDAPPFVLVLDADTRIEPGFIEAALAELTADDRLGAVSGLFVGEQPASMLQQLQANEYVRYGTQIRATGRVSVVTGTASMFRTAALRDVAAARGTSLPGIPGDVYDRAAITEDSELTLALKNCGWRMVAPDACVCTTELMPTWGDLHRQRVRWYKGMLDNLREYGISRVTLRYFAQQAMILVGILTIATLLLLTALSIAAGAFAVHGLWLALGSVFVAERIVTVWPGGSRARLLAAAVLPEIAYDMALQAAFLHAVALSLLRRDTAWNHVTAPEAASLVPSR